MPGNNLSPDRVLHFRERGWIAPLDVCDEAEAAELLRLLEEAESRFPDDLHPHHRNNAHLAFPFLAELSRDPRIVDSVSALVGDDISLWSSVLFIKEPASQAFVSWHQDATYMALAPDNFVTAWLALTPSTPENGCVAVIPGTHVDGMLSHDDTFGEDNILTRGQEVSGVDERSAVDLVLRPGQMSLHHPWLVHGSRPNTSEGRRVGIAFQSYMGSDVRPVWGEHHVSHIRGAPAPAPFVAVPEPTGPATPDARAARDAANQALADVLYSDAAERRQL